MAVTLESLILDFKADFSELDAQLDRASSKAIDVGKKIEKGLSARLNSKNLEDYRGTIVKVQEDVNRGYRDQLKSLKELQSATDKTRRIEAAATRAQKESMREATRAAKERHRVELAEAKAKIAELRRLRRQEKDEKRRREDPLRAVRHSMYKMGISGGMVDFLTLLLEVLVSLRKN